MYKFKGYTTAGELFEFQCNVQLYESDCFVLNDKSYYIGRRDGNVLYVSPITKTVHAYQ